MRVVGVVVVDGHPVEPRAQVALHVRYERACVRLEIEALPVLRGDDELPEPRIARLLPTSQGRREVDAALLGVEAPALPALALGALARQVRSVGGPGGAPSVTGVGRLHGAPLPPGVHASQEGSAPPSPAPALVTAPAMATGPAWQRGLPAAVLGGEPRRQSEVVGGGGAHQSTVHTGRATASTCDTGIGPTYRLSQLLGTRVLTTQTSPAPTTWRPQAVCSSG